MGCGKKREVSHLFFPSKTTTLVPEFAVEEVRLGRTLDDDDDDDDAVQTNKIKNVGLCKCN